MTPRLMFRPEARAEVHKAQEWYDGLVPGLGSQFALAVDLAITLILRHPAAFPIVHGAARKAVLRRFPYSIIYVLDGADMSCWLATITVATR